MTAISLFPVFLVGLLGSVHCIGMCGGIVSALSMASTPRKPFPVAVMVAGKGRQAQVASPAQRQVQAFDSALRVLAYNAGRIGSYMAAGALAGGMLGGLRTLTGIAWLQIAGYWLANLMLIALGLYLIEAWRGLATVEAAGRVIWRHIQPLTRHFLPMDNPLKAVALGGLWGWVPCGMVYSMLLTAMLSGSSTSGALTMLAFGLGTLPMLLALGMLGSRLHAWLRRRAVRMVCGLLVLAFGLIGMMRAADGTGWSGGWLDAICVTPAGPYAGGAGGHR